MSQSVDSRPQRGLSGPCGFQGHQTQQAGLNAYSQTGCWRYPHDTMSRVKLPQYSKAPFTRKKTKKKKKSMMISYTALIQTEKWRVSIVPLAGTSSELRGGWFALAAGLCSDSLSLLQGATACVRSLLPSCYILATPSGSGKTVTVCRMSQTRNQITSCNLTPET